MKKIYLFLLAVTCSATMSSGFAQDLTPSIPILNEEAKEVSGYRRVPDHAEYGRPDWPNLIGKLKNVSVEEACAYADKHPEIDYFFYIKGGQMVLGNPGEGPYRVFRNKDAVFFKGQPWWAQRLT